MATTYARRIARLEDGLLGVQSDLSDIKALLTARLEADRPAREVQPKADRKAKKAPQPKADRTVVSASHTFLGERVGTGSRKLTKANRQAFIAAHAWAKPGMSTNALRSEVAAGRKVNKGWSVAI